MGAQKARAMRAGAGGFDIDEFVAKLVTFMGGKRSIGDDGEVDDGLDADDYLEWDLIGRKALAKSRRVPAMTFMFVYTNPRFTASDHMANQAWTFVYRSEETGTYQARQAGKE